MRIALAAVAAVTVLGGLAFGLFGTSPVSEVPAALSSEEFLRRYDAEKQRYIGLFESQGPSATLSTMRREMEDDTFISAYCHEIAHEVGRAAAPTYGSFAEMLQFQDEICASGYLHGIMEGYFTEMHDASSTTAQLGRECSTIAAGTYARGQCFHGVGHGLMFSLENELPQAISLCETYAGRDIDDCASGAYMENFNTDQHAHPSAYLRTDDFFYPCMEQDERHKSSCYLYAPLYFLNEHGNDFSATVEWCSEAEAAFQGSCFNGVGFQVARRNALDPKFSEAVCMQAGRGVIACLEGFLQMHISINNLTSRDQVLALCEELRPEHRSLCKNLSDISLPSATL